MLSFESNTKKDNYYGDQIDNEESSTGGTGGVTLPPL